jgi:hypothetical protein
MSENTVATNTVGNAPGMGLNAGAPTHAPKEGFERVIHGLREKFLRPAPLEGLADVLFTMGARQQRVFGIGALALSEERTYELLRAHTVRPAKDFPRDVDVNRAVVVGIRSIGRPFITPCAAATPCATEDFGYVLLDEETHRELQRVLAEARAEQRLAAEVAVRFFETLGEADLADVVATVKHGIDHIDPVIIYTHQATFTNFATFNNLLGRMSEPMEGLMLDDLAASRPHTLSVEAKEFLYCFYVLKLGGFRGEEFSGQQLTCTALDAYLAQKLRDLRSLCGEDANAAQPQDLCERARLCKEYRAKLRVDYFVCRRINGLSFHKDELYIRRDAIELSPASVPSKVREYGLKAYGKDALAYSTIDAYFGDVVARIAERFAEPGPQELNLLEDLMRIVIESSIEESGSSIGMSRGFRDLQWMQRALQRGDVKAICDRPTTDYYCAVFVAPEARRAMMAVPGRYKRITTAIATRMTFNSWHYTPGHFAGPNMDGIRHFYHPPRMSDRAEWSDQHHTGHVQAGVRYSIRSPASLRLAGKKYYGMIDLRLMRDSEPYTDADVIRAKEYTAYLRAIMQAAADITLATGQAMPVQAFTKQWYAKRDAGEV